MPFLDFLNKYRIPDNEPVESEAGRGLPGGGATRFNTLAEKQRAEMVGLATGEAQRLASEEERASELRKQRALQSDAELQSFRNERTSQRQKYTSAANQIKSDLERNLGTLTEREKLDQMEAVAQAARLQDEKYAFTLADEGRRRRLQDARQFDIALKESVFEDEVNLLKEDLKFRTAMDMDEANFQRWLTDLDLASALAIASQQQKDANRSAVISGVTQAASKGAGYYFGGTPEKET